MECQPIRAWAGLCSFSPSGYLLAAVIGRKITIQETGSDSEGTLVFLCADNVEYIEWSADSQLILSCCASQAQLEVWSVHRPEWKCRVQAGAFGIHSACFAPSSRHVLITSKLFLRISIWSLLERSVRHIDLPKDGRPGLDFRPGGSHVAVAERRDARDCVAIYSCHSWTRVALIDTETVDLGGVRWSPDGGKVAVWDSVHAGRWSVYSMAGALLGRQESAGDIHDVQWNPSAQLLAVAQSGSKVQLIAHLTWRPIATLEMHWSTVEEQSCVVYAESDNRLKYHVRPERPVVLGGGGGGGVGGGGGGGGGGPLRLAFSCDGRYLAVSDRLRPQLLWLWHVPGLSLVSVLLHQSPIEALAWSPVESCVAIACGAAGVSLWTPAGCGVFRLQASMRAATLQWNADGRRLLVAGRRSACLCQLAAADSRAAAVTVQLYAKAP